jgi:hypothetical protein
MVAEEDRVCLDVAGGAGIVVVLAEKCGEIGGAPALRNIPERGVEETKVQHPVQTGRGGEFAKEWDVGRLLVSLAKLQKPGVSRPAGGFTDSRGEGLPKIEVDVLDRVDAKAVDAEFLHPVAVDVDKPAHHVRVLRERVVEPAEVSVKGALALEGAVAAVVVVDGVVQPWGILGVGLSRRYDGNVGKAAFHRKCREDIGRIQAIAGDRLLVEGSAVGVPVGSRGLGDVVRAATLVLDDVGGVVDNDVEEDLEAACMGLGDERLEFRISPEVRVNVQEIENPITVVAGCVPLQGLVAERGSPRWR